MNKKIVFIGLIVTFVLSIVTVIYKVSYSADISSQVTALTLDRINEIRNTKNTDVSKVTGNIYYVSNDGNDSNDGLSSSKAIKTITKLNELMKNKTIKNGDAVLFRRGDTFRGYQITLKDNNILFGSYGDESKAKPNIYGSKENYKNKKWVEVSTNIWKLTSNGTDALILPYDVGSIWFFCNSTSNKNCTRTTTDGKTKYVFGYKKTSNSNVEENENMLKQYLTKDLEFYHMGHAYGSNNTATGGALYVYSTSDPSTRFDDIEVSLGQSGFGVGSFNNIVIDNVRVAFFGHHGVGAGSVANLKVTNSEFAYIGGMVQSYNADEYWALRYGNGIEIYGSIADTTNYKVDEGFVVSNNYIYEIYDAGITFQLTAKAGKTAVVEKVLFDNNVVENCSYDIEYWNSNSDDASQNDIDKSYINKVYFTNNILRFAGIGLTETRPEHGYEALIKTWDGPQESRNRLKEGGEFIIENNILDTTGALRDNKGNLVGTWMLHLTASSRDSIPTVRNNKFYNYKSKNLGYVDSYDSFKGVIPYGNFLNYNETILKDNEFVVYDGGSELTSKLSGKSNEVDWSLDLKNRTLTISGTGKMADYSESNKAPWYSYREYINTITIGENVTYIGKYAFYECFYTQNVIVNSKKLTDLSGNNHSFTKLGRYTTGAKLTIGENVEVLPKHFLNSGYSGNYSPFFNKIIFKGNELKTIDTYALAFTFIEELVLPESVETIGSYAFYQNPSLKLVIFPDKVTTIKQGTMKNCSNLETIVFGSNLTTIEENSMTNIKELRVLVIPSTKLSISTSANIIDKFSYLGVTVYAPSSMESTINEINTKLGSNQFTFVPITSYRPIIYGDMKNYYALFDDLHYGDSGKFNAYALSNSSVNVTGAKYRYYDRFGFKRLIDGVNINVSTSTINNIRYDVELVASVSNKDSITIDKTDILFLGNSLLTGFTKHGMASTRVGEDYYAYVMNYIKSLNSDANGIKYKANPWEEATTSADRQTELDNMISTYNSKIKSKSNVGMVFIQLGDNINSDARRATFSTDIDTLVKRFKSEYPNAKIYLLYGRYITSANLNAIKSAASNNNAKFLDITYIASNNRYDSYMGASYLNWDNHWQKITDLGVAVHPGNYGNIAIADTIIKELKGNVGEVKEITSTKYTITNKNIIAKPTSADFKKNELTSNLTIPSSYEVYVNGSKVTTNVSIGTGATIKMGNDTYKIIVLGDVTGDGKISLGDLSKLYNHYKGKVTLTGDYLEAGKVNRGTKVTLGDLSKLYNFYKGKLTSL